ncbi:acetylxylan esterase [Coraliomargarita sp. W4R72]
MTQQYLWGLLTVCGALLAHATHANSSNSEPSLLPPAIDVGSWDIASWRAWPFDYEVISERVAPLSVGKPIDWVHAGDSWVAKNEASDGVTVASDNIEPYQDLVVTDFYITAGGNSAGPNRIYCATAVPKGVTQELPVLFVFHGGGGHASGALALALARNNIGFATVAIDYNGQFRPSDRPVTQWVSVTEKLKESRLDLIPNQLNFPMYHYAQASRRVLDWTEKQVWADPKRMGAVGISYGGWVSFFLASNDSRIRSVYTQVSSGGTAGMRGRSSNPHDWQPKQQRELWKSVADPIVYAPDFEGRSFFRIAANDRFFWLDGASQHRDHFKNKGQWMVTPNSDHGVGGPKLPDPIGLWHRSIYMGEPSFPSFSDISFTAGYNQAVASIDAVRPLQSVHMAWSPSDEVSVARYWRWIEASEENGKWSASIPSDFQALEGTIYFTAIDVDGRTVSSDLVHKRGDQIESSLLWENQSLWDQRSGANAWRADLSFGGCQFKDRANGSVVVTPVKPGSRIRFLTNSFLMSDVKTNSVRGIKIYLNGNGEGFPVKILLAQDFFSLDNHSLSATVQVPAEGGFLELPWNQFKSDSGSVVPDKKVSANGLVLESQSLPASGLTVGAVQPLDGE